MNTILFSETLNKKQAIGLIHKLYITQLKQAQIHTASTKTKSEVRGGGRKPRPQKGQGYARSGSTRSPLWVGGGVIFGPKPHTVTKKINKKEKKLAILSAFFLKKKELIVTKEIENLQLIKTKDAIKFFKNYPINLKTEKILCILSKQNKEFWIASRNIKNIRVTTAKSVNIKELLWSNRILLSEDSLSIISNKC
jgi:large subunit ribosomal protein L4